MQKQFEAWVRESARAMDVEQSALGVTRLIARSAQADSPVLRL